ncbi:MAG: hypothetical protein ACAH17_01545 [Candidatus Paceibacterota bacterium]
MSHMDLKLANKPRTYYIVIFSYAKIKVFVDECEAVEAAAADSGSEIVKVVEVL